jgi:hypothetical protein
MMTRRLFIVRVAGSVFALPLAASAPAQDAGQSTNEVIE